MMGGRKKNILKECEEFVISLIKKFDKRVESSSSMMQKKAINRPVSLTLAQFASRHQRDNMSENMVTDVEEDYSFGAILP